MGVAGFAALAVRLLFGWGRSVKLASSLPSLACRMHQSPSCTGPSAGHSSAHACGRPVGLPARSPLLSARSSIASWLCVQQWGVRWELQMPQGVQEWQELG